LHCEKIILTPVAKVVIDLNLDQELSDHRLHIVSITADGKLAAEVDFIIRKMNRTKRSRFALPGRQTRLFHNIIYDF